MAKNPLDVILGDIQSLNKRSLDVYKGAYKFARSNARSAAKAYALGNIGTLSAPAAIYLSNVLQRSGGGSRPATNRSYSSMKPGSEKVRSGPKGAIVGSSVGGGSQRKTPTGGAPYIGSTVGGNTGRRQTPSTPAKPSAPSGDGKRNRSGAKAVKAAPNRTAMVKKRLQLAEQRAARGDVAGAAAYANAALAIQRKGKGTAASMRRVENVASAYSQKAAAGRPTVKRKKG